MVETIRQIAADLHSAAASLKSIEAMLVVLTRGVIGGTAALFVATMIVAVRQK